MTATSSIDELLNIFYEINYSYLREDESKDFIDIITSNPEKKIIYKKNFIFRYGIFDQFD